MISQGSDTVTSIFKYNSSNKNHKFTPAENGLVFIGTWNIRLNFMASEFCCNLRECRFYTAGCVNKMAVSVTGPRAVNELDGPVIPGSWSLGMAGVDNILDKNMLFSIYSDICAPNLNNVSELWSSVGHTN